MRFRYFDGEGAEVEVSTVEALAFRIQTGAVQPETLLFDAAVGEWRPARDHPIFQFVQDEGAPLGDSRVSEEAATPQTPAAPPKSVPSPEPGSAGTSGPSAESRPPPEPVPSSPPAGPPPEPDPASRPPPPAQEPRTPEPVAEADEAVAEVDDRPPPPAQEPRPSRAPRAPEPARPSEPARPPGPAAPPSAAASREGPAASPEAEAAPRPVSPSPARARSAPASLAPLEIPEGIVSRDRRRAERPSTGRVRRRQREDRSALAGIGVAAFVVAGLAVYGLTRVGAGGWSTLDQALSLAADDPEPRAVAERSPGEAGDEAPALARAAPARNGQPGGAGGPAPEAEPAAPEEPRLSDARVEELAADVLAAASGDLAVTVMDLQAALEVPDQPPDDWMEGIYLAEAARYPAARDYWERVGYATSVIRALEDELFRGFVKDHVAGMRLDPEDADVLAARVLQRFAEARATRMRLYDRLESLAHEAVGLHDLLVRRTDAIRYEPFSRAGLSRDPVIEAVPDDPELARELWDRMDRLFDLLDEVQGIGPVTTLGLRDALLEGIEAMEGPESG